MMLDHYQSLTWLALDAPHGLRGQFIKDRQVIPW